MAGTAKLILVRHGHVDGLSPERFRGRENVPLSAIGLQQARTTAAVVAARWRPIIVYTSPLNRCVDTGAELASLGRIAMEPLEELNDLDYGAWQWSEVSEIAVRSPELLERWRHTPHLVRFPNGESLQDLYARATDALRLILSQHEDEAVAIVSHDSVLRVLLLHALDLPLSAYGRLTLGPCGLSQIDTDGDRMTIVRVNETAHLDRPV